MMNIGLPHVPFVLNLGRGTISPVHKSRASLISAFFLYRLAQNRRPHIYRVRCEKRKGTQPGFPLCHTNTYKPITNLPSVVNHPYFKNSLLNPDTSHPP
jgi:hypothetical protein